MQALLAPARRTRAADLARWCVRAGSGSASRAHGPSPGGVPCGGHHHSHGPDGPDEAGTLEEGELDDEPMLPPAEPPSEDSGLPVAQRAKNILAANWRGQLSTIELKLGTRRVFGAAAWAAQRRADATACTPARWRCSKAPRKPAIHGSLVPFALLPGGEPVVFLAPEELHVKARPRAARRGQTGVGRVACLSLTPAAAQNAAENPLASLTVGATDPAALAALRDEPRCVLPRVSVLGALSPMDGADADYARRRAAAAHAAAAPEAARPALEGMLAYKVNVECVFSSLPRCFSAFLGSVVLICAIVAAHSPISSPAAAGTCAGLTCATGSTLCLPTPLRVLLWTPSPRAPWRCCRG